MLDNLLLGLHAVLAWEHLFVMFLATLAGLVVGVVPGLGPITAMALLIPFTFSMQPLSALLALASISVAANCSGAFTSILLNVPGETSSAATCFDGHPMAKQGRATVAIGLSIGASFFAAVIGVLVVIAIAQPLVTVALAFGPPEYFALAAVGISLVAGLSANSATKGLMMAAFGLWLSSIGVDSVIGEPRFTFGLLELQDGINLVPVMTGIFAITEIMDWMKERGTISRLGRIEGSVWQGIVETFRYPVALIRSTFVGIGVGVVPGVGAVAASFLSYEIEKRFSKDPSRFGKGAPEGVIAPEASNNSAICAGLAPALTLGVPGGATSALLLVALTVHGIRPGPMLFTSQPSLIYGFLVGLIFGAVMFLIVSVMCARALSLVTLVRAEVLGPIFLVISFAGVFAQNQQFSAVIVAIIFGVVGCIAKAFDFPAVPLVLGLVLGRLLDTSFNQSLAMSDGSWMIFLTRPISGSLLAVAAVMVAMSMFARLRRRKSAQIFAGGQD
ncbi:MAG: tricarboxylate transport rane protein TctA [Xanthobacteraceae bacterium]|nr:tricarboxylate transport rane protein TctA [Xanthobacteraceae bacterium]